MLVSDETQSLIPLGELPSIDGFEVVPHKQCLNIKKDKYMLSNRQLEEVNHKIDIEQKKEFNSRRKILLILGVVLLLGISGIIFGLAQEEGVKLANTLVYITIGILIVVAFIGLMILLAKKMCKRLVQLKSNYVKEAVFISNNIGDNYVNYTSVYEWNDDSYKIASYTTGKKVDAVDGDIVYILSLQSKMNMALILKKF